MAPTTRPALWLSSSPPIVTPAEFRHDLQARDAIMVFSSVIFDVLARRLDMLDCNDAPPGLSAMVRGKVKGDVILCESSFGAPAAGMLMEALVASGVRRFFMLGEAGAVSPQCHIGDVVLPAWGVREEGTSYHYLEPSQTCGPSPSLTRELGDALGRCRQNPLAGGPPERGLVLEGGVWTIDAPFRETRDKVEAYAAQGVLAVEMEFTALAAIAMYRNVEFASALIITDELHCKTWVSGFTEPQVRAAQEAIAQAMCHILAASTCPR